MKHQLIMLETPIIVSDEKTKCEDYAFYGGKVTKKLMDSDWTTDKKIIAGIEKLPSIDFNGFEEQLGYFDVEKILIDYYSEKFRNEFTSQYFHESKGFKKGFKKAQELNNKKFSLEDMEKCFYEGCLYGEETPKTKREHFMDYYKSISQPKVFDIELEMENSYFIDGKKVSQEMYLMTNEWWDSKQVLEKKKTPRISNNEVKIIKIL